MPIILEIASERRLAEIIEWLKAEDSTTSEGFYCNRKVVTNAFLEGSGICAVIDGAAIGFSVYQMFTEAGKIHIVEVHPSFRGRAIGSQLLEATVKQLRKLGAYYVDVECTSRKGEALCRRFGFEDYADPRNHRNEWDNPTLRIYLSDRRPPVRSPWN